MQIRDYAHGMITNWGGHIMDIVQWVNDSEHTGPVEVEGKGNFADNFYDVLETFDINYKYANGVELNYSMAGRPFVRFEGTDGWAEVEWFGKTPFRASSPELMKYKPAENEIHLPLITEKEDFINSVKARKPTLVGAEIGQRSTTVCLMGVISIQTGNKKLAWDPASERFTNNDQANKLLTRPMREPWQLQTL
jgi:myo-inositol 2-dehydrogenase/D-chiro-inositol 1-dehydrogenase